MDKDKIDVRIARDILREQEVNIRKAIPQSYLFSFVYGIAWIVGYGALALTGLSKLGYMIFGISLFLAMLISILYLVKTLKGIKTVNSKYVAWWGVSWWLGFMIHVGIMRAVGSTLVGVDSKIVKQISWSVGNSIPLLIVSLCFFGGASIFKKNKLGLLGIVISIVAIISANLSPVYGAILCAIAGGIILLFAVLDFRKCR